MSGVLAELFVADHGEALERSRALDAGEPPGAAPHMEMTEITPEDLETLGEVVAGVVRFGAGDVEVAEVDLEHEALFRLSSFMTEALVELTQAEDPDAVSEVAKAWAEEMQVPAMDLVPVVRAVADLAAVAERSDRSLHLWVRPV